MKRLIIAIILGLTGCGYVNKSCATFSGAESLCHKGVSYVQFPSGASVEYNVDGTIKLCN